MIFVGNRKQTVERDGVLVTLTPGMPIPEARTWPNLKRAAAMGRVYADAADGDAELIAKGPSHSRSWLDMAPPVPAAPLVEDTQSVGDDPPVESAPTAEAESVDEIVDAALRGAADAPAEQPVATTTKRKR